MRASSSPEDPVTPAAVAVRLAPALEDTPTSGCADAVPLVLGLADEAGEDEEAAACTNWFCFGA